MEISAILSNIKYKQYSLPKFQRSYVWRRKDVLACSTRCTGANQ